MPVTPVSPVMYDHAYAAAVSCDLTAFTRR